MAWFLAMSISPRPRQKCGKISSTCLTMSLVWAMFCGGHGNREVETGSQTRRSEETAAQLWSKRKLHACMMHPLRLQRSCFCGGGATKVIISRIFREPGAFWGG